MSRLKRKSIEKLEAEIVEKYSTRIADRVPDDAVIVEMGMTR